MSPASIGRFLDDLQALDVRVTLDDGQIRCSAPKGALTPEMREQLRIRKDELRAFLQAGTSSTGAEAGVSAESAEGDALPLSPAQERVWFFQQLEPDSSTYNLSVVLRMRGALDVVALKQCVAEIVRRHDILRTRFSLVDGEPAQQVDDGATVSIRIEDLSTIPRAARDAAAEQIWRRDAAGVFNLVSDLPIRLTLIRLDDGDHQLVVTMHHIAADGTSLVIFMRELIVRYAAARAGQSADIPALPIQYGAYAREQRKWLASAEGRRTLKYWVDRFSDELPTLELPTDRLRPAVQTFRGGSQRTTLSAETSSRLRALSRSHGSTLFMTLLAALDVVLFRFTGDEDIIIGAPTAGRDDERTTALLGMFVNTVALRADLSGNPTFDDLLIRVRDVCMQAFANQDLPFARLLDALRLSPDLSRTPLFQVMLNMFTLEVDEEAHAAGVIFTAPPLERMAATHDSQSKFDLTVYARDGNDGIHLSLVYNADLFSAERMDGFMRHFEQVLDAVAREPRARIGDIVFEPISTRSREPVIHALRPASFERIPSEFIDASISARFAQVVDRQPDRIAIAMPGDAWTYRSLSAFATRVGELLNAATDGGQVRVGLLCDHDAQMIGTILGVLAQGSAYVPLDPAFPEERLALLLDEAQVDVVIAAPAHSDLADRLARGTRRVVRADADGPRLSIAGGPSPDSVAYVLYTSGSTGRPKGVWQNHRNVLHYVRGYVNALEVTSDDRLTLVASYTFDASIVDIFSALLSGATLYPIQPRSAGIIGIRNRIQDERVTIYHSTPTLYRALSQHLDASATASVRAVVLGGEKVRVQDVMDFRERFDPRSVFVNLYGASEVTIASMELIGAGRAVSTVGIGTPIDGTELTLLAADGAPAPVRGEIAVTSRFLPLGYWNAPELTAQAFSHAGDGRRMYRTGDLARRSPDGTLEFLGRKDQQVKIRGIRIELGEIETVLGNHSDVHQAAVTVERATSGEPMLVAFVVLKAPGSTDAVRLKDHLRRLLPEYMLPTAVVVLDAMPLTRTGKIDRRSLPSGRSIGLHREEYVEPRNAIEAMLAEIWREVLGVESIGIRDNFFGLGGNSLNATQVLARLQTIARVNLPLRTLFTNPTIEAIAKAIDDADPAADGAAHAPLEIHRGDTDLPLSFSQERMWFLQQVMPASSAYNMAAAIELTGPLDRTAFEAGLRALAERHQPLRVVFPTRNGEPRQQVVDAPLPLIEHDLRSLPVADRMAEANRIGSELAMRAFDLEASPPWWVLLARVDEDRHACVVCFHHIISDLWSFGVFFHELSVLYNAHVQRVPTTLPALGAQYGDFAAWQHEWFRGERLEAQLDYWRQRLAGIAPLELPTDRPRPPVMTASGDRLLLTLPSPIAARLRSLSIREGVTPFMTLLATFSVLLSRYSGQTDIAVGVPIANRTQVGVEGLIGTFVNTLVHRNDLSGNPTFREVIGRVRGIALDAYANQDLSFDRIVRALAPDRDASRSPVFQVLFNLANAPNRSIGLDNLKLVPFSLERGATQFDLVVNVILGDSSAIVATFNTDLFDRATIEDLLASYVTLLDSATRTPDQPIARLAIVAPEARRTIVEGRNATAATFPNEPVTALISAQAARTPEAIAVEYENTKLTYAELEERSTRLARYLRRRGVADGSLVGVCLNRSADIVVALLGVLKAGAAYVPIDPTYPSHRVQFMLEDSGAAVVITESALLGRLPDTGATIVALDRDRAEIEAEHATPLDATPSLEARAYVIYTSGSTGNPKGVQIPHRALTNFLWSMQREPGLRRDDALLAVTTISFDIAGLELYLPLISGATIVLASTNVAGDGRRLRALLEQRRPTVIQATPATWRALIDAGWEGDPQRLKVLCGGEAMSRELANSLLPRAAEVWNVYGPTETTIWSTVHRVTPGSGAVSIGKPIANTSVYVLDANGQPVPDGVHGELYIGGLGVALGYLNRPELTESRFLIDPFANDGSRMYRTGDRARYRRDGTLEHLGRLDFQVKVRGYRIELGEIETALDRLPEVLQSITDVRQDRLVAYIVFAEGKEMTASEVRAALRETLPDFMVPSLVVPMERLPLTPNGKVDRKALPDPLRLSSQSESSYVAPATPMEVLIATVWRETLGVERIGTGDNFFELGGHSLLSMRVVHEIHQRTGWRPEPRLLFFETLGRIAAAGPQVEQTG